MPVNVEEIKKHKAPPPVADINVTPMVDVMLVMLIIFMVITPMLQHGVSVDMAKTDSPKPMEDADKEDALIVAIPAVWMFNYFTNKIEAFDVEMGNSSSELIDYFLKRSQRGVRK